MKLKDQVAIVTGAGRNIGEETAKLFASEGAGRRGRSRRPRGGARVDAINAAGGKAKAFVCDVSKEEDFAALVKAVVRPSVASTSGQQRRRLRQQDDVRHHEEEWDRVLAITLTAPFLIRSMWRGDDRAERGGKIVKSSTSGYYGRANAIAYTTAKGGVVNLTRSLAIQLAPTRFASTRSSQTRSARPSARKSSIRPARCENLVGRAGAPIEARASAMLFLDHDDSEFIVGAELFVDGGTMAMDQTGS